MELACTLGALRAALGERTLASCHALALIAESPDGIDQLELARMCEVETSTLAKMVKEFRDSGYVQSAIPDADRRRRILQPTERMRTTWRGLACLAE